jgi:hypothetical protein
VKFVQTTSLRSRADRLISSSNRPGRRDLPEPRGGFRHRRLLQLAHQFDESPSGLMANREDLEYVHAMLGGLEYGEVVSICRISSQSDYASSRLSAGKTFWSPLHPTGIRFCEDEIACVD